MIKYTTSDIIKRAMQLADLENSDFISDYEKLALLNESWTMLYQKLINAGDKSFIKKINIKNGCNLPCDLYQISSIYTDQEKEPLVKLSGSQRDGYDIVDNHIVLSKNYSGKKVVMEYYPIPKTMFLKDKIQDSPYPQEMVAAYKASYITYEDGNFFIKNLEDSDVNFGILHSYNQADGKIKPAWSPRIVNSFTAPDGYYALFEFENLFSPFSINGMKWDKDHAEEYGWTLHQIEEEGQISNVYTYNCNLALTVTNYPAYTYTGKQLLVISDKESYLDLRTNGNVWNRAEYNGTFNIDGFNRLVDFNGNSHTLDESFEVSNSSGGKITWDSYTKTLIKGSQNCSLYWDVTPYDSETVQYNKCEIFKNAAILYSDTEGNEEHVLVVNMAKGNTKIINLRDGNSIKAPFIYDNNLFFYCDGQLLDIEGNVFDTINSEILPAADTTVTIVKLTETLDSSGVYSSFEAIEWTTGDEPKTISVNGDKFVIRPTTEPQAIYGSETEFPALFYFAHDNYLYFRSASNDGREYNITFDVPYSVGDTLYANNNFTEIFCIRKNKCFINKGNYELPNIKHKLMYSHNGFYAITDEGILLKLGNKDYDVVPTEKIPLIFTSETKMLSKTGLTNVHYLEGVQKDSILDYPNNLFFIVLSYILAIAFKSKQGSDIVQLQEMANNAEIQFFDSISKDNNSQYTIKNVYSIGRGF